LVLLLDEPLAGLDDREAEELMLVLRGLQSEGLTVVLVDHAIGTVAEHVERMFVLDNGRDICDGQPAEVMRAESVLVAYLGPRWTDA
jgi:branched-chain amino acid transport system ATP-binding protein